MNDEQLAKPQLFKKLICALLGCLLAFTLIPAPAFADEINSKNTNETQELLIQDEALDNASYFNDLAAFDFLDTQTKELFVNKFVEWYEKETNTSPQKLRCDPQSTTYEDGIYHAYVLDHETVYEVSYNPKTKEFSFKTLEATTKVPNTEAPTTDQPAIDQPEADQPTIGQPVIDQPTIGQPEANQPTTNQPETDQPEAKNPDSNPITKDENLDLEEKQSEPDLADSQEEIPDTTLNEIKPTITPLSTRAAKELSLEPLASPIPTTNVLSYQTHVQADGWQAPVKEGATSGTSGRSLRLEGIKLNLTGNAQALGGAIEYRTHVQNIGWQAFVGNGAMSGTSGRSLRLEAIQIKLSGKVASSYDVYYRVHAQNLGWMGWAKNGAYSGTAGLSYRLEGIQIKLVAKGTGGPSNTGANTTTPFVNGAGTKGSISYSATAHIQAIGDKSYTNAHGNSYIGTTGNSYRMESMSLSLNNSTKYSGSINYRVHAQNVGWQEWKRDGERAGTTGRALRLEAIEIYLSGDLAQHYDVFYRAHVQNIGWQSWVQNGASAGTSGKSLRIEGLYICLVKKGDEAPAASNGTSMHQVVFKNYDGRVLQTYGVKAGSYPQYQGTTPTRPHSKGMAYTFTGWSPAITKATQDAVYTAQFSSKQIPSYNVTFKNHDGSVLSSKQYAQGSIPQTPSFSFTAYKGIRPYTVTCKTPQREDGSYVFTGWDKVITPVTGNVSYTAQYKPALMRDGNFFPTAKEFNDWMKPQCSYTGNDTFMAGSHTTYTIGVGLSDLISLWRVIGSHPSLLVDITMIRIIEGNTIIYYDIEETCS